MMSCALSMISILSTLHFTSSETQISGILEPYDLLFDNAVEAYYKQDWLAVILNMERALRNKAAVRKARTHCRLSCANHSDFGDPFPGVGVPIPGTGPVEDLAFFQRILQRADCVNACEIEKVGPSTIHKVSETVELEFKKRTPYNYLQVAYFKINKLDKAVAAANTFFMANPDHIEMKQNLEYYSLMAGVQETDYKDLEERSHMSEFMDGKMQYSMEKFAPAIDHFESAVEEYFTAYEECRVLCEGTFNYDNYMEYNADLFQAMTDYYLHSLNCKQNCAVDLASSAGREKPYEDFLPSHFNYLQFSYYNSEKYEQAIECARTYLLFHPEDEVMLQNLAYYSAVLGEDKAANISAREVVKQHIKRSLLEKELLYFGYEIFGKTFVDPDAWTPENIMPKKLRDKQKADRETAARITEEIGNLMKEIETLVEEKSKDLSDIAKIVKDDIIPAPTQVINKLPFDDIIVSMTSAALNGSQRVVLDGVTSFDECQELRSLSNTAALQGDDYKAKPSPRSPSEMFQELTVLTALQMAQEGVVPPKSARFFYDVAEKIRKVLESHFGLESLLFFSDSKLVCRSAAEEKHEGGDEGCLLVSELNECIKDLSLISHGDYSAILYLNDDFEGGDFVFTKPDPKTVTAVVKPQCGRVLGFGGGPENLNDVTAVTKGQRCAVVLQFTLNPQNSQKERLQAEELLKTLFTPENPDIQKTINTNEISDPDRATPTETSAQEQKTNAPSEPKVTSDQQDNQEIKPDRETIKKPKTKAAKKPAKTAEKKKSKAATKTKPTTSDEKKKPPAKKKTKTSANKTANNQKTKSKSTDEHKDEL